MDTARRSRLGIAGAALAVLVLMLSSQIAGSAASQLQEQQATSQSSAPSSEPSTTPPQQSSPGQLSYTNTWNRTQPLVCTISAANEQAPLLAQAGHSWTLTSSVPLVLAGEDVLSSQAVKDTYTVFSNGTFLASDNQGNSFSWPGVTGLPAGAAVIKLYANSNEALQLYSIGSPGHLSANFTVAYTLMQTSGCQPHGLSVTIQGWATWPNSSGGSLRIGFRGEQMWSNSTEAEFGGKSGSTLVFDWSDTMTSDPASYQSQAQMVSWSVGGTFRIDPSIIGTSSSQQALNWGDQRKLWHTVETNRTAEYWAFYFDGDGIEKAWSLNGVNWYASYFDSTPPYAITSGSQFSSWLGYSDGVYTLYYVLSVPAGGGFLLGSGKLGNNGAVSGLSQTWFPTVWSADSYPCVYGSSSAIVAGVATSQSGSYQLELYDISPGTMHVLSKLALSSGSLPDGCIALGLTSGYALVYGAATTGGPIKVITSANANSWSSPTITPTTAAVTMSSAITVGNTVDFATIASAGEVFWSCAYPCTTTSSVLTLAAGSGSALYDNIVLSTNSRSGGTSVTATYHTLTQVWSRTSDDGGNSWTPPQLIDENSTGLIMSGSLQADYDYVEGGAIIATTDVAWVTGTSAPYDILFPAFPAVVPSADSTSDPWAVSGYSPYESYFSQLSEYVSPGNGLLGVSQTDLSIPGRTPALSVTRVFSTPAAFTGPKSKLPYAYDNYTLSNLGIGWELGFPWIGTNYFHPGDGASIPLSFNSSGIMEYHGSVDFVLYKNANDTYTLYTADGTKYVYTGLELTSITSPDSPLNTLTFAYNSSPGYITQISDAEGRVVAFSYNANNTLASISSGGLTWKYTYKGSDLSSVTDPLGEVTRFYYASYNPWLITEIAYPTGAATYYTYNTGLIAPAVSTYAVYGQYEYSSASSQVLVRENTYLFNMVDGSMVSAQVLYENDSGSLQGYAVFDFRNIGGKYVQLESQKDQSGNLISSVETTFDQDGRPNQTMLFSPQGTELASSVTRYDNWGNVNFTQDYDGHDEYFAYANTQDQHQFGNGKTGLLQDFYTNSTIGTHIHDDLLGSAEFQNVADSASPIETFYLYDNGEVLKQSQLYVTTSGATTWLKTSYTYDSYGNLVVMTDPLGHQTCYAYSSTYDGAYLTSETTSGSSNCHAAPDVTVSSTYNIATGYLTSQTDGEGNTTVYSYDALGRLTSVMYPAINGVRATTSYSYNDATNVVTAPDQRGNITKYYYDGLGRLTQEQTFLSPTSPYSSEYYTYNWLGEVLTDEKPNGGTYTYAYDSLGRMVEETNPDGSHETMSYNVTTNTETVIDGDGHETQNVYDFTQQLVAVREYWSGGGYNATAYTYDGVGNLVKVVGPNAGQVTQYSYDDLNRLVKTTYPDGTAQKSTYDAVGDLTSTTDQEGRVTTYSYDYLYRLSAVNYPDGSSTTYTYDNDGNVLTMKNVVDQVKYSYDALNDLLSETDTIGGTSYTTSYNYDLTGNVQSITYPDESKVSYSYDALDRVTKVSSGATTYASFTYNYDSTTNSITYGNGEVTKYSYDSMSRPTSMVTTQGSTQELSLAYKYDNAGNIASINSEPFGYDAVNRLTSATGPWGTLTYSYDAAGNMVQETNSSSVTTTNSYNSVDELVRSSSASGATTYSYDGDGDLVVKNDGTNIWTYEYNTQSELTKVLENGVLVQQNHYDGSGNRVEQTTGATTTLYLYADDNILYEKNLQTGVSTKHVYADGLQVASISTSTVSFVHQDELGSTRLVTGSGSSKVFSSDYLPYGIQYGSSGTQEFMYTGQLYDSATGLYYFNARFYDPSTGRFLTVDPLGGVLSDPQSLNAYAYARDNPLAIVDPSGMSWSLATSLLFGAAVGLGIVSALQLGLDPITDALDAAAITDFAASLATVTALGGGINLATNAALSGGQVGWNTVGLSFGFAALGVLGGEGEGDEPIPDQLVGKGDMSERVDEAEQQLAEINGGERQVTIRTGTWMGNRRYDVWADPNTARELKFGSDPVTIVEILKDVQLRDFGGTLVGSGQHVDSVDVTYDFVSDPVTGNSVSQRSLNLLNEYGIPYHIWGPEFWEY